MNVFLDTGLSLGIQKRVSVSIKFPNSLSIDTFYWIIPVSLFSIGHSQARSKLTLENQVKPTRDDAKTFREVSDDVFACIVFSS